MNKSLCYIDFFLKFESKRVQNDIVAVNSCFDVGVARAELSRYQNYYCVLLTL